MKVGFARAFRIVFGLVLFATPFRCSYADELKVVNSMGLIRAVKIIRAPVTLRIQVRNSSGDELSNAGQRLLCSAVNTDGLASERSVEADRNRACIFKNISAGTWQIQVQGAKEWSVFFDE